MARFFQPIRGTEEKILAYPQSEGNFYVCTDTRKMYMDTKDGERIPIGGAGNSGIYYGLKTLTDEEKEATEITFTIEDLEGDTLPSVDDLILNQDGSFFRVLEVNDGKTSIQAKKLTVSGSGGGGDEYYKSIYFTINYNTTNLISGRDFNVILNTHTAIDKDKTDVDEFVVISYELFYTEDGNNYVSRQTGQFEIHNGELDEDTGLTKNGYYEFNIGNDLIQQQTGKFRLVMVASEANYTTKTITRTFDFTSSVLSLSLGGNTSNSNFFNANECSISYKCTGNMAKILDVYFDERQLGDPINLPSGVNESSVNISQTASSSLLTHGYHTVKLVLSQNLNNQRGLSVDPIEFEIAVVRATDKTPIIWLQPYKSSYYNYDPIQIYFNVYDPMNTKNPTVTLYKDNKPISTRVIQSAGFQLWEITDGDVGMQNSYAISCGSGDYEARREISFLVEEDTSRKDYHIETDSLLLSFDASGRSNSESPAQRSTWTYSNGARNYAGEFKNFNWYNNGWITDKTTGKTCLRISNGASFEIPVDEMIFGDAQNASLQSNTIEFQLKIRNIQNYNNLIRNITRYQNDSDLYSYFNNPDINPGYTNYDSFLAWYLKNYEYKDNQGKTVTYDDLQFSRIEKIIDANNIVAKFAAINGSNVIGVCLGPQDALFSNGVDTVNVSYVENEIITVSAVYQHAYLTYENSNDTTGLMFIYINGVLTGVCKNTRDPQKFTIGNGSNKIILSSNYCDIDLYKIRLYNKALNVVKIINNYSVDVNDVSIFDLNQLASENRNINEYQFSYDAMIDYNTSHPSSPIMPYVIFDATQATDKQSDKLSFSKKNKIIIDMDFVNTPLEQAFNAGELTNLAIKDGLCRASDDIDTKEAAVKKYYLHHCPSFTTRTNTDNVDGSGKVSMAVQGTSSEFYPRRNYKVKTKTDDGVQIYCNRGPFSKAYSDLLKALPTDNNYSDLKNAVHQDWFYMNNYTCGTTKFTMKIDFMESSGTYNMGFANLVNNAYTHHPLEDYKKVGALATAKSVETRVDPSSEYKNNITYYYYNHKGKLKYLGEDSDGLYLRKGQEAADFALGPIALARDLDPVVIKVSENDNYWYTKDTTYIPIKSEDNYKFTDYRTSVQGFRVLAFWKRSSGNYQYIGMYNMLIDKGSDECYGFKPSKTMGTDIYAPLVKEGKKMDKAAECWEFSDNTRTYCSYRDPLQRDKLSFDNFTESDGQFTRQLNALGCAPMVCDSFEYRYNDAADLLDYLYDNTSFQESPDSSVPTWSDSTSKNNLINNKNDERAVATFDLYKNWEKACQWVWSTCTDIEGLVQNSYVQVSLAEKLWTANTYYVYDSDVDKYVLDTESTFNENYTYYVPSGESYLSIVLTDNQDSVYVKNKYYTMEKVGNNESYFLATGDFDNSAIYYKAQSAESMEGAKPLIKQAEGEYQEGTQYYTYDWTKKYSDCVQKVTISKEEYDADPSKYYVQTSVTYGSTTYNYDTKEYRLMKFQYELPKHFNVEYMATYFVMTEVFECYDSRGKNCMMASWGPQEKGGEYIWYPIFYDIDTQLGINNTGIPSFEYNVDATIDGNFSTSDSVLWNNFYTCFKGTEIVNKYRNLKGVNSTYAKLAIPPIDEVDTIEGWYTTDPNKCNQIVMRGLRPLVAKNLDEFYKYISITNPAGKDDGITGYIDSSDTGVYSIDQSGLYFYALQGDRSLSRRQFLTNRIEYIDSWLNEGNYKRGGMNRIRGRIAANSTNGGLSDIWVETSNDPYWKDKEETIKSHPFDGEYWINFQPVRSSYVTVVTDNEAFPSKKYDGINPVKFIVPSIENGVRKSLNYPEQLFYLQGVNQMSSFGDLSKIYYTEFAFEGEDGAPYLTDLRLGYDGLMVDEETGDIIKFDKIENTKLAVALPIGEDGVQKYAMRYYNGNMKYPGIPAGASSGIGMPLLKEVNLCNINLTSTTGQVNTSLDFSGCEKLENFRATGSNLTQIKFAQGVALNTLYMPASTSTLTLVEARQLKDLIKTEDYEYPTYDVKTKKLTAKKGLYMEGLFDSASSAKNLQSIKFANIGLGINSYILVNHWYQELMTEFATSQSPISYKLTLTDSNWSPYMQVGKTDNYDESKTYVKDNSQYGFEDYTYIDLNTWKIDIGNGEIYEKTIADTSDWVIKDINMLKDFISNNKVTFVDVDNENNIPNISGIIYIENDEPVDETYIRNEIQPKFPNLTFFFKSVNKGKTVRYLLKDDDGKLYQQIGIKTYYNDNKETLNPKLLNATVSPMKQNYDFYGWSFTNSAADICVSADDTTKDSWTNKLNEFLNGADTILTIYAVFTIHKWNITWIMPNGSTVTKITHGEFLVEPDSKSDYVDGYSYLLPYKDASSLAKEKAYSFAGWSLREDGAPIQLNLYRATKDYILYAQFEQMDVRDENYDYLKNPDRYFEFSALSSYSDSGQLSSLGGGMEQYGDTKYNISSGYMIKAKTGAQLQGKITIPSTYNGNPVFGIQSRGFADQNQVTHYFFEKKSNLRIIQAGAFINNQNIIYFDLPEGLRMFSSCADGNSTFVESYSWDGTDGIVFPSTLIGIGKSVFQNCFTPTSTLQFNSNLVYLGARAFKYCKGLEGGKVIIGGPENSKLLLTKGSQGENVEDTLFPRFLLDIGTVAVNIEFTTKNYISPQETVNDGERTFTVQQYFSKNANLTIKVGR